jgi:hypothetical protein
MDSTHLRIGNFVIDENNVIKTIGYLDLMGKIKHYKPYTPDGLTESEVLPIPLTKEWLFKFGFKWIDEYEIYDFDAEHLQTEFLLRRSEKGFVMMDIDITVVIEYVHQLQNLFFALIGTELVFSGEEKI